MKNPPDYVPGHGLLRGKSVLVTAAAGAGIGFAVAKRAAEDEVISARWLEEATKLALTRKDTFKPRPKKGRAI